MNVVAEMLLTTPAPAAIWATLWILTLPAVLLLASTALYRTPFGQRLSITTDHPYWAGLPDEQRNPVLSYAFWFVGIPLLYGLYQTITRAATLFTG